MSLFNLKQNNAAVKTEIIAGLTTFFTMSYIIFVNPMILSTTGMPLSGIFAATIIASALATLLMGLYANVPFALAPGMGLNAFFAFTLCLQMGFSWQQALAIDFLSGSLIIIITATRVRKMIIFAIPDFLKSSISVGIGLFIAYIGMKNANFLNFLLADGTPFPNGNAVVPSLTTFTNASSLLALIGLTITIILIVKKVKGALFIGIIVTTIIGLFLDVTNISKVKILDIHSASGIKDVCFAAFTKEGFGTLFSDVGKTVMAITGVLALFLSATFDALGSFIGAGRVSGIFDDADLNSLKEHKKGLHSKFEKALLCDGISSSLSGIIGTSTVTTYIESAAGISVGAKTGLSSVVVAVLFFICLPFAGLFAIVPAQAVAPALIIVGVFMTTSILKINWSDIEEAIPAFLTIIVMVFAYNITYGIAAGFIFHCIIKLFKGKIGDVHPILISTAILFILNFLIAAVRG
jgi:AGZA family xanthine/uracil permease-like MFS transporter